VNRNKLREFRYHRPKKGQWLAQWELISRRRVLALPEVMKEAGQSISDQSLRQDLLQVCRLTRRRRSEHRGLLAVKFIHMLAAVRQPSSAEVPQRLLKWFALQSIVQQMGASSTLLAKGPNPLSSLNQRLTYRSWKSNYKQWPKISISRSSTTLALMALKPRHPGMIILPITHFSVSVSFSLSCTVDLREFLSLAIWINRAVSIQPLQPPS